MMLYFAKKTSKPLINFNKNLGFTLIEVLVALVVLAIGFLAMATLQALSLSSNNSSAALNMATIQTYSILDVMRADIINAKAGAYNIPATPTTACPTSQSTFVDTQISQWCNQIGSTMGVSPTTTGAINCTNIGYCTITIVFDNTRTGAPGATNQQVVTNAFL